MPQTQDVLVWDRLVRVLHWALVVAFFTCYLTEGEPEWLHAWSGYLIIAIVLVRIVWGVVGPKHARFSDFVTPPRTAVRYLRDETLGRARRYLGHNPAGGAMIVALLASLLLTTASGVVVYGTEGHGPLAASLTGDEALEETMEKVHEVLANFTLLLVIAHVAGVLLGMLRHRENLIGAMWHGRKRPLDPAAPAGGGKTH